MSDVRQSPELRALAHSCDDAPYPDVPSACHGTSQHECAQSCLRLRMSLRRSHKWVRIAQRASSEAPWQPPRQSPDSRRGSVVSAGARDGMAQSPNVLKDLSLEREPSVTGSDGNMHSHFTCRKVFRMSLLHEPGLELFRALEFQLVGTKPYPHDRSPSKMRLD